jgi:hypothetical protein
MDSNVRRQKRNNKFQRDFVEMACIRPNKQTSLNILLLSILFLTGCGSHDSLKQAQKAATDKFEDFFIEADMNKSLFRGPTLVKNDESEYVFQWASVVPESGATIFEISVSKSFPFYVASVGKGKRAEPMYLASTGHMPFNEAMLTTLFNLPSDTSDHSIFVKPLREVQLTQNQLSDVASFIHIKRDLMEYNPCYKNGYPDSLEEFKYISNPDDCAMFALDSMFTHDHWGNKYFYKNLGNKVILGTPGKNGKWDFSDAVMDSIFNFHLSQIYVTDDDIIVKFSPE